MSHNKSTNYSKGAVFVFTFALLVRLVIFFIATPRWINVDEFYYLSQGQMIAEGLRPYTDFLSPYPPGASLVFSPQHFLLDNSWVITRLISIIIDACNAYLVFRVGYVLYNRTAGAIASLLYIINPLSIFTNAASMSETYMLLFILVGFNLLLRERPRIFLAGYFFAFAFFIKYYALLFFVVPLVYIAYRRIECRKLILYTPLIFLVFLSVSVSDYKSFVEQTLLYYGVCAHQPIWYKLYFMFLFLVLMQPHVIVSWRGFAEINSFVHLWWYSSVFFLLFPAVFEHHIILTLPASCLIAGSYIAKKLTTFPKERKIFTCNIIFSLFVVLLSIGFLVSIFVEYQLLSLLYSNNPQHLFSNVYPVVSYIKENTGEADAILSDYPEYPYLSERKSLLTYSWGYILFFKTEDLITELDNATLIIVNEKYNYPSGFVDYLESNYDVEELPLGIRVFQNNR